MVVKTHFTFVLVCLFGTVKINNDIKGSGSCKEPCSIYKLFMKKLNQFLGIYVSKFYRIVISSSTTRSLRETTVFSSSVMKRIKSVNLKLEEKIQIVKYPFIFTPDRVSLCEFFGITSESSYSYYWRYIYTEMSKDFRTPYF